MGILTTLIVGTALVHGTARAAPAAGSAPTVLRHALIVGANDGGEGLEPLRYAEADAGRVHAVLAELGGFDADRITVLASPDRDELEAALRRHASLARGSDQDLFLFYYSGHADSRGLRLGEEVLPFADLKQQIRDLPAEVRLGVLDACRSGEITRIKGFKLTEPFATEDSLSAEGEAWLTATAADEEAQESDTLRGSFFTHYLVSGLRGAADGANDERGDGVVSLVEAYDYAFDRTVARTGGTSGGTQHPGYDFRLQGQGDLPLTDVSKASARIVLPRDLAGEITVIRLPDALPVAEVAKAPGKELAVALAPGRYLLRAHGPEGSGEARIGLSEGSTLTVRDFREVPEELAMAKGGPDPAEAAIVSAPLATRPERPEPRGDLDTMAIPPDLSDDDAGEAEMDGLEAFRTVGREVAGGLRGAWEAMVSGGSEAWEDLNQGPRLAVQDLPRHADDLDLPGAPAAARPCTASGPDCLVALAAAGALPPGDGSVQLLHPSGRVAGTGTLTGGKPVDTWVYFYDTGERHSAGQYLDGVPSGEWAWWWANGRKRETGDFADGQRAGVWTAYYENGRRHKRTLYSAGQPGGKQREWFDNGKKKSTGEVLGEHKHGRWVYWYDNGRKRAQGEFNSSGRTGTWRTWYENGEKRGKGPYIQDLRHGPWTHWHENGVMAAVGTYDRGEKHGRWREFDEGGRVVGKGRYAHGRKVGRWVEVDPFDGRSVARYDGEALDGSGEEAEVAAPELR